MELFYKDKNVKLGQQPISIQIPLIAWSLRPWNFHSGNICSNQRTKKALLARNINFFSWPLIQHLWPPDVIKGLVFAHFDLLGSSEASSILGGRRPRKLPCTGWFAAADSSSATFRPILVRKWVAHLHNWKLHTTCSLSDLNCIKILKH